MVATQKIFGKALSSTLIIYGFIMFMFFLFFSHLAQNKYVTNSTIYLRNSTSFQTAFSEGFIYFT